MRQTLFYIPYEIDGWPVFGFGVLLAVWAIAAILLLAWLARRQGFNADTMSYLPLLGIIGATIYLLPGMFSDAMPIRGYGVMLLLAGLAGVGLAMHRARQMGLNTDHIVSLALWLFIAGIAGARLFHVIEYWSSYQKDTLARTIGAIVNVPQGGLVVYGSLIGASLAFFVFVRKHRLPSLAMADLIAPSLAIGLALGRVGCLLNGCCFGGLSEHPWAVAFPPGSPPYMTQLKNGDMKIGLVLSDEINRGPQVRKIAPGFSPELSPAAVLRPGDHLARVAGVRVGSVSEAYRALGAAASRGEPLLIETEDGQQIVLTALPIPARSLPVHPTQIYSAINAILLCLFLWSYYPFRRRDGEVIALLLSIYPISRFLIERIRIDEPFVFGTQMSISQNISIVILAAVVGLWIYIARQPRGSALEVVASPSPPA